MTEQKFMFNGRAMGRAEYRIAQGLDKPLPKSKADISTDGVRASRELEEREAAETEVIAKMEVVVANETTTATTETQETPSKPILKNFDAMTYQELIAALKTAGKMPSKSPNKKEAIALLKGDK